MRGKTKLSFTDQGYYGCSSIILHYYRRVKAYHICLWKQCTKATVYEWIFTLVKVTNTLKMKIATRDRQIQFFWKKTSSLCKLCWRTITKLRNYSSRHRHIRRIIRKYFERSDQVYSPSYCRRINEFLNKVHADPKASCCIRNLDMSI